MRTPLNGVLGIAALLDRSDLDDGQAQLVGAIRDSGSVLLRLIDDLLDSTRLENGDFDLIERPFVVCDVIRETVRLVQSEAQRKGLVLAKLPSASSRPAVLGDAVRLKQVLLNLLANAIKFTDSGSVTIGLDAALSEADVEVAIWVEDTGIGIDPADNERIFRQFEQLEDRERRRGGGVGLGLSIADRLVRKMGGRIALHSVPGQGSRFTVHLTLPLAHDRVEGSTPRPGGA